MALQLLDDGINVGIAARRTELLDQIKQQHSDRVLVCHMDLLDVDTAIDNFEYLIKLMTSKWGPVDLIVLNSGTGSKDPGLDFELAKRIIGVNVTGFTALANISYNYLMDNSGGTMVGVTSIAGIRGNSYSPTYPASKAFMATYLEGLRCKSSQNNHGIRVIDIKPGFVDTAMGQSEKAFWRSTTTKAVAQMLRGIHRGNELIVVTRRWYLIAWIMKHMPLFLYRRLVK